MICSLLLAALLLLLLPLFLLLLALTQCFLLAAAAISVTCCHSLPSFTYAKLLKRFPELVTQYSASIPNKAFPSCLVKGERVQAEPNTLKSLQRTGLPLIKPPSTLLQLNQPPPTLSHRRW